MGVVPGAEPWQHEGGKVGVLLVHGFTGSPASLRPMASHLAAAGLTVSLPLLPGHGTSWQDLNRTRWPEWFAAVDVEFAQLRARCRAVVVVGLSMGGALALRLAQTRPTEVDALVLINPAVRLDNPLLRLLPALKLVLPSTPAIGNDIKQRGVDELAYARTPLRALHSMMDLITLVRADLPAVTQPILLFRSPTDHVVPATSSAAILSGISSADITEVICPDSHHVATLDHDAPMIFNRSLEFIERVTADSAEGRERDLSRT